MNKLEELHRYNGTWTKEGREKREDAREKKLCANCGKSIKHPQLYYCSRDCAEKFFFEFHEGIWSEFRLEVLRRDNRKCVLCGKEGTEVDHIIELDRGGTNRLSNLRTLCHSCHRKKTTSYIRKKHFRLKNTVLLSPDILIQPPQEIMPHFFPVATEPKQAT